MNTPIKTFRKRTARKSSASPKPGAFFDSAIQRKCEGAAFRKCEDDDKQKVQKKTETGAPTASKSFFNSYMGGIQSKGQPLGESTRGFFENRLSGQFGDVRIHTDSEATMAAKAVNAKAFTWQNHIVFNQQYFNEQSAAGKQLLAHELTHVLQQREQGNATLQRAPEDEGGAMKPMEETAEAATPGPQPADLEQKATEQETKAIEPEVLPNFSTFGKAPEMITVFGQSVTVQGETHAEFDSGMGTTRNLKAIPAKDCDGCSGPECVTVTGQLVIKYNVSTNVILPDVPEGLTPCQQGRVRDVIDNKIKPHEAEHVTAFNTYKGTVTLPINFTGCKADIQAHVQAMHEADNESRTQAARAKSAVLDPFVVPIDLDCAEPPKK